MAATVTFTEDPKTALITVSDVGGTLGSGPALTYTLTPPHRWASTHDFQKQLRDQLLAYSTWLYGRLKADTLIAGGDTSTFSLATGDVAEISY